MPRQTAAAKKAAEAEPSPAVKKLLLPQRMGSANMEFKDKSGEKVSICCKHPMGLLLRVYKFEEFERPVVGGGVRVEKEAVPISGYIKIDGYSMPATGRPPKGKIVEGDGYGFAITEGISKEFWDLWCKQNADHPMLTENLLFEAKDTDYARDMIKEADQEGIISGMEPIDPLKPPKVGNITVEPYAAEDPKK